ncbi:hypothetical protein BDR26DRAFT_868025 [Obelidium mucronatum]|nr:hypothetical protein BDR26DRAFT_868025 [Obelidium mucronatum]
MQNMSSSDAASHLNLWFAQGSHHAHHPPPGPGTQSGHPGQTTGDGSQPGSSGASPYANHAQLQYPPPHQQHHQQHQHTQQYPQHQPPQYDYSNGLPQFPVDPHQQYHYAHHGHQQQHYPDMQHYQQMDPSLHYGGAEAALFQPHGQQHDPNMVGAAGAGAAGIMEEPAAPTRPKKGKKKTAKRTDPYGDGSEPVVVNNDGSIPLSRAAFKTVCKYCCLKKDENPQYQMGVFHKGKCTNPVDPEHGSRWLSLRCKSCAKDVCTSSEIYKRHQCPPGYPSPMPGKSYRTHRRKKEDEGDIDDIDQYWTEPGNMAGGVPPGVGGMPMGVAPTGVIVGGGPAGGAGDFGGADPSAYHNSLNVLSQLAGEQH